MKRVIGLGGIFIKCRDQVKTSEWYQKHLGIQMETWGAQFNASDDPDPEMKGYTVFSLFKRSTEYFNPSEQPFMVNFKVDDLDALVAQLKLEEVEFVGMPTNEEFGKFAWIMDPEGNKIELWEPAKG
jgi:predicted enzyme related to lactoylglutathione lyase